MSEIPQPPRFKLAQAALLLVLAACASNPAPVPATASATFTAVPPSATATATATAVHPTATATPEPPTATATIPTTTPLPTETLTPTLPPPTPSGENAIYIYYVKVEQDTDGGKGESKKKRAVRCDITLVPVNTGLARSGDVETDVTTALGRLFSKVKGFGDLANPAYLSNIAVQRVDFNPTIGLVDVRLVGTYVRSGDGCDDRRVREQVWTTIRQFAGIKTVYILLNDNLLGDILATGQ